MTNADNWQDLKVRSAPNGDAPSGSRVEALNGYPPLGGPPADGIPADELAVRRFGGPAGKLAEPGLEVEPAFFSPTTRFVYVP
jgi:hypothetical protein